MIWNLLWLVKQQLKAQNLYNLENLHKMYHTPQPSQPEEKLFLNTIPFELPQEPLTFWFSKEDIPGLHLKRLTHINRPVGIETIFPGLKNNELICNFR